MRRRVLALMAGVLIALVAAAAPAWEEVTSPQPSVVQLFEMEGTTEVIVKDGYIYIWSQKPMAVKLFSILGQQIHSETVPAGIHRLRLNTKGIFILKAGTLTKRIAL